MRGCAAAPLGARAAAPPGLGSPVGAPFGAPQPGVAPALNEVIARLQLAVAALAHRIERGEAELWQLEAATQLLARDMATEPLARYMATEPLGPLQLPPAGALECELHAFEQQLQASCLRAADQESTLRTIAAGMRAMSGAVGAVDPGAPGAPGAVDPGAAAGAGAAGACIARAAPGPRPSGLRPALPGPRFGQGSDRLPAWPKAPSSGAPLARGQTRGQTAPEFGHAPPGAQPQPIGAVGARAGFAPGAPEGALVAKAAGPGGAFRT